MEEILQIAKNAFPPTEGSEFLEGIKEEVEILWDKWGIPHIYAKSLEDAYCAQGYIHARHRLWQMELFRRLTTGEISELTGSATLDMDKHYKISMYLSIIVKNIEIVFCLKRLNLWQKSLVYLGLCCSSFRIFFKVLSILNSF